MAFLANISAAPWSAVAPEQPRPDYPDHLAEPAASKPLAGLSWSLLLGLVVFCMLPRAVMAWKIGGVCPDAVLFIRLAEAYDAGNLTGALERIQLNVYPLILMCLHRLGLSWEAAGACWGVFIASCTVLPLVGWVRRLFDDRVAVAAGFLYAIHPCLIRWSPEVIRDSTFWFLFTLALYLLWRAVTETRWYWFAAAGFVLTLACVTRFEGLVLFGVLGLWAARRGWAQPELRRRLILGGCLGVGIYPLTYLAATKLWFHGHTPMQLLRTEPLELAQRWAQEHAPGEAGPRLPQPTVNWHMIGQYITGMFKGLSATFVFLYVVGTIGWWRVWKRWEHQSLLVMCVVLGAAIWVHSRWAQSTGPRYFFSAAIMLSPFAALGLLRLLAAWVVLLRRRWAPEGQGSRRWAAAVATPLIVLITAHLAAALGSDTQFRAATVALGQWAQERFGPSVVVYGPEGVTQVVGYYARGQCQWFLPSQPAEAVAAEIRQVRPDVVLMHDDAKTAARDAALFRQIEQLGFVPVDRSALPGGCRKVRVWTRGETPGKAVREPAPSSQDNYANETTPQARS